jgi:LuxR family transcriptional regulator, regulator of acetate metabolism
MDGAVVQGAGGLARGGDPGIDALEERIGVVLDDAYRLLERAQQPAPRRAGFDELDTAIGEVVDDLGALLRERAEGGGSRLVALATNLVELQGLHHELREHHTAQRLRALTSVHDALARLRGIDTTAKLIERCPQEVCEGCGFERAVISRVVNSEWFISNAHYSHDPQWARDFVEFSQAQAHPRLDHMILETEMIRRRAPALVPDATADPRSYKPLVDHAQVRSYVAAPIMPAGRVIGFLHADYRFTRRAVDTVDRDVLWAFAEGFGHAFERAVLRERLQAQRTEIHRMMRATEEIIDDLCNAEIQLSAVTESESAAVARTGASIFIAPQSRLDSLLTKREVEVLSLMADGSTNAAIANELVISEGTVKSHVKHILRKLRASNRAEAVSRYLRLCIREER